MFNMDNQLSGQAQPEDFNQARTLKTLLTQGWLTKIGGEVNAILDNNRDLEIGEALKYSDYASTLKLIGSYDNVTLMSPENIRELITTVTSGTMFHLRSLVGLHHWLIAEALNGSWKTNYTGAADVMMTAVLGSPIYGISQSTAIADPALHSIKEQLGSSEWELFVGANIPAENILQGLQRYYPWLSTLWATNLWEREILSVITSSFAGIASARAPVRSPAYATNRLTPLPM